MTPIAAPSPEQLEDLPVQVDRAANGIVTVTAWSDDNMVTVSWDTARGTAQMVWRQDGQDYLSADRSDVTEVSVRELGDDGIEFVVLWGAPHEQRQLVARVLDPVEMTDTPVTNL
ncbi:MAG: hypothetical protein ABIR17_10725 [Pseudolysinimonas sp.]|uniref:hypothetical protein n=1 Tax=Pseudolysinimonas sp. TaxID=2680009 RepID=UPI003266382F